MIKFMNELVAESHIIGPKIYQWREGGGGGGGGEGNYPQSLQKL